MIISIPKILYEGLKNPIFLYHLVDPRTNKVRYIGKTNNPKIRYNNHLYPKSLKNKTHKNSWLKNLLKDGLKPTMYIVGITTNEYINEAEISAIASTEGLTNMTGGGDGQCLMTEEVRNKIKASNRGGKRNPCSEITKKKISEAQIGKSKPKWTEKMYTRMCIPVKGIFSKTGSILFFKSIADAANFVNCKNSSGIIRVCKKQTKHKTCKGYFWEYVRESDNG